MKFEVRVLSKQVLDPFTVVTCQMVTDGFVQGGKLVLDLAEAQAAEFLEGENYEFGLESDFSEGVIPVGVPAGFEEVPPAAEPEGPPPDPPAATPPTGPVVESSQENAVSSQEDDDYDVVDDPPMAEAHSEAPPDDPPPAADPDEEMTDAGQGEPPDGKGY